jgi:hypothetical protein
MFLTLQAPAEVAAPEPGPEAGGMRLRLLVTPKPDGGNEGYDVQMDLISVSREAIPLRLKARTSRTQGNFTELLEAGASIESYPAIEPWMGQLQGEFGEKPEPKPDYTLNAGEMVTVKWHAPARHLKNKVSNPLEVQDPEFAENGLYSIHASLVLEVKGRPVLLRSNEQTIAVGGSQALPKHTYGVLRDASRKDNTAMLGLGSLHKVAVGDQFLIRTGLIGMSWTLTITQLGDEYSYGTLAPTANSEAGAPFPSRGWHAAYVPKK